MDRLKGSVCESTKEKEITDVPLRPVAENESDFARDRPRPGRAVATENRGFMRKDWQRWKRLRGIGAIFCKAI